MAEGSIADAGALIDASNRNTGATLRNIVAFP
jgi:hypothetical protein